MKPMAFRLRLTIAAIVAMPGVARADDAPPPVVPTISPTVSASTIGDEAVAVSDDSLSDLRGGFALVQGNQTLSAVSTGSVLNGDFTAGAVSLTDNALSNFNGFGNVVINTGAQNSLQAGMNITINFGQ